MSKTKIKIDGGIPVPEREHFWSSICNQMAIGDSFLIEKSSSRYVVSRAFSRCGFKMVTKKEGSGWRVWKAEKYNG